MCELRIVIRLPKSDSVAKFNTFVKKLDSRIYNKLIKINMQVFLPFLFLRKTEDLFCKVFNRSLIGEFLK